MKNLFSLILLFLYLTGFSQTFYEKAAFKACDCLKKLNEVSNDEYINCLSSSFASQMFEEEYPEIKKLIGTVEGIQAVLKDIDFQVKETCNLSKIGSLEAKKEEFYQYSENENARNFYIIAKDFMKAEKYELAIEGLLMSLESDKTNVLTLDDLAISYRRINDYENAIKYYNKSLEIFPEGDFALMNIGVVYSLMEDYEKSNEYYKKLIQYYPDEAEGYYGLGKNSVMLNDFDTAIKNIAIAHRIYLSSNSGYSNDTLLIMTTIHDIMKEIGMEKDFERIASENNVHFTE